MSTRTPALGRGLGALLPGSPPPAAQSGSPPPPAEASGPASDLAVDLIDPNPDQPRRIFDSEQLERLADSIRQHGVLQPVVVRRVGSRYQLVVGERRWRATQQAGLATIPAASQ